MKKTPSFLACLALAVLATSAHAGSKFYKWTDAQGVTHYTAEPPPSTVKGASEVKVRSQHVPEEVADAATSAQEAGNNAQKTDAKDKGKDQGQAKSKEKEKDKEQKKEGAAGNERYAERCTKLNADLDTMKTHTQIRVSDGKGEAKLLSDEEKNAKQDEVQRQIKAFCE